MMVVVRRQQHGRHDEHAPVVLRVPQVAEGRAARAPTPAPAPAPAPPPVQRLRVQVRPSHHRPAFLLVLLITLIPPMALGAAVQPGRGLAGPLRPLPLFQFLPPALLFLLSFQNPIL